MVEYKASKRIVGTSAERATMVTEVPHWQELDRTILTSAEATIDVTSLADKRYYMILNSGLGTVSNANYTFQLNGDTELNYSNSSAYNGTQTTSVNQSSNNVDTHAAGSNTPFFAVNYLCNFSTKEKLGYGHSIQQMTAGAGTAPQRSENATKWANTSSAINQYTLMNGASTNYASGSEVVVLGYDPADTSGTNFWEELVSVDLSGGVADTLSASIADKKYLWIQAYIEGSASAVARFRVGDTTLDNGSNYANRYSSNGNNGGVDEPVASDNSLTGGWTVGADKPIFWNIFIVNNATNEKLAIVHGARRNAAGADIAPSRFEVVGKWAETTNQIGIVGFDNDETGDFKTNCVMKVWGSD